MHILFSVIYSERPLTPDERRIKMEDKQIVELYWARSEAAISETDKKYGKYCHYIAFNVLGSKEDAEEVVNDTYLKLWNSIPPKKPEPLKPYAGTVCRNTALKRYTEQKALKRGGAASVIEELNECVPDGASQNDIGESIDLRDALNRFVRSLPARTQKIFISRYFYASPIADIARGHSKSESYITVLLLRTRKKLKQFLEKEGLNI